MEGFVKFFGTGGARFVVSTQLRATGGLWLNYRSTNLYIDPGPGALVRIRETNGRLDPARLDGILLTHMHLDHANDVNVLIEAMTEGGFKKRGVLYCPADAVGKDHVVLRYVRKYLERIEIMEEKQTYTLKDISFSLPVRHVHQVETYGIFFHLNKSIALIADTRYFDALPDHYRADYLIVNVLRSKPIETIHPIDHLALDDFVRIVTAVRPEKAIMTHFGTNLINEDPQAIAERLKEETGIDIIAAWDGMKLEF
jgi:phosphoribosyl 1,2-cyclic phosphodiesterase